VSIVRRKIIETLTNWKNNHNNMPFMLIGARQVGKTYVLDEFCKKNYPEYIYINLEYEEEIKGIFDSTLKPEEIIDAIGLLLAKRINPEKTVIFFDEIQVSERAVTSLKYFNESDTKYNIVCAGSLLGVALNKFKSSFPVGKVFSFSLYPMDFQEFLWALGEDQLDETIQKSFLAMHQMMDSIHQKCLGLYKDYLFVGGMPASILEYIKTNRRLSLFDEMVKKRILDDYLYDMSKYTTSAEQQKIGKVFKALPKSLGHQKKFNYKAIDEHGSKRKYESSIDWLLSSQIANKCTLVRTSRLPLNVYEDGSSFKLYVADTGLLMSLARMKAVDLLSDSSLLYKGMIAENYVAQTFTNNQIPLHFWKSKHNAEIDFLISMQGMIIPVEVKSSSNTKSKSLKIYRELYSPSISIKLSANNFNKSNGILSIPLYAAYLIGTNHGIG
jgi:predicted AAA+ superfamily ATPase